MDVDKLLEEYIPRTKHMKEETARDYPEDPDMISTVEVWRDERVVAHFGCPPHRDAQLFLIRTAIQGMSADTIVFSMETCQSTHPVNPGTGKPWESGEMTEVIRNKPDWFVDGMVQEAVSIFAWNSDGHMAAWQCLFTVDAGVVTWNDEPLRVASDAKPGEGAVMLGGYVMEQVAMYWHDETVEDQALAIANGADPGTAPPMTDRLREEIRSMSAVERRARADLAIMSFIEEEMAKSEIPIMGALSGSNDPNDERTRILRDRLVRYGDGDAG